MVVGSHGFSILDIHTHCSGVSGAERAGRWHDG